MTLQHEPIRLDRSAHSSLCHGAPAASRRAPRPGVAAGAALRRWDGEGGRGAPVDTDTDHLRPCAVSPIMMGGRL